MEVKQLNLIYFSPTGTTQKVLDFGAKIKDKVAVLQSPDAQMDLEIPGSFPYEAGGARSMAVSPVTKVDTCTVCGTCASVCPTAAISINGSVATEIELCIRCCACIKTVPQVQGLWKTECGKILPTG